jgi:hypothetical protein
MLQMATQVDPSSTVRVNRYGGVRPGIELIEAVTAHEKKPAASLITSEYANLGYFPENSQQKAAQVLCELSSYKVWIAKRGNDVLATLGYTSNKVLPMDAIYGPELSRIRDQGIAIGEVGMFACNQKRCTLILHLMARMFQAASQEVNALAITIHPRHLNKFGKRNSFGFYVEQLGFQLIDPNPRFYSRVGVPAHGLYALTSDIKRSSQKLFSFANLEA